MNLEIPMTIPMTVNERGHLELDTRPIRRSALLEAAAMAEKIHRINVTPQRDVSPEDLAWYRAEPQATLRRATSYAIQSSLPGIAAWLRALGGEP